MTYGILTASVGQVKKRRVRDMNFYRTAYMS